MDYTFPSDCYAYVCVKILDCLWYLFCNKEPAVLHRLQTTELHYNQERMQDTGRTLRGKPVSVKTNLSKHHLFNKNLSLHTKWLVIVHKKS